MTDKKRLIVLRLSSLKEGRSHPLVLLEKKAILKNESITPLSNQKMSNCLLVFFVLDTKLYKGI
jgi:hypothetical protein